MKTQNKTTEKKRLFAYEKKDIEGTHFGVTDSTEWIKGATILKYVELNESQKEEVQKAREERLKQQKKEQETIKEWLK